MTVLSSVAASALADGTSLSQADAQWVRIAGTDSTEFIKYGDAIYQNGPSVVSTHAIGTQDREITLELIDSYDGGNSGGMKFFLAYKAASNIDGIYLFHDGTSWRLRRFITYIITISDAAFNQGNVRRKCVLRSEGGNVTLSVYDASDVLIGSQTVNNALDVYTGALPVCIYDGTSYSVGDAVNQDGVGYMSIKVDDLQSGGGGTEIDVVGDVLCADSVVDAGAVVADSVSAVGTVQCAGSAVAGQISTAFIAAAGDVSCGASVVSGSAIIQQYVTVQGAVDCGDTIVLGVVNGDGGIVGHVVCSGSVVSGVIDLPEPISVSGQAVCENARVQGLAEIMAAVSAAGLIDCGGSLAYGVVSIPDFIACSASVFGAGSLVSAAAGISQYVVASGAVAGDGSRVIGILEVGTGDAPTITLKAVINMDVSGFLNPYEFGELHTINGKKMNAVVDNPEYVERSAGSRTERADGIFVDRRLVYVAASEFGIMPAVGEEFSLDGERYTVQSASDEMGMYAITIVLNDY